MLLRHSHWNKESVILICICRIPLSTRNCRHIHATGSSRSIGKIHMLSEEWRCVGTFSLQEHDTYTIQRLTIRRPASWQALVHGTQTQLQTDNFIRGGLGCNPPACRKRRSRPGMWMGTTRTHNTGQLGYQSGQFF